MRIKERCSCGAEIEVDSGNSSYRVDAMRTVEEWRTKHQHQIPYRPYSNYPYITYGSGGAVVTPVTSTPVASQGLS